MALTAPSPVTTTAQTAPAPTAPAHATTPTHAASAYNASVPADILYLRIIAERIRIVGPDGDIYVLLNVLKICPKKSKQRRQFIIRSKQSRGSAREIGKKIFSQLNLTGDVF